MLTKHTYFLCLALLSALALAAPAAAAPPEDRDRTGLGSAIALAPLSGPVVSFHRAIDREVQRIRAEHRAEARRERRQRQREFELPGGVSRETLDSIAACESGGDPAIVSSDGSYRGKYQFSISTWASVGGQGDPAVASEAEQDYRAALLYSRAGPAPWPVCGS